MNGGRDEAVEHVGKLAGEVKADGTSSGCERRACSISSSYCCGLQLS